MKNWQDRLFVVKDVYVFNKLIFQFFILLSIFIVAYAGMQYKVIFWNPIDKMLILDFGNKCIIQCDTYTTEGKCYRDESINNPATLYSSCLSGKTADLPFLVKHRYSLVFMLIFLPFLLNHILHNRKYPIGKKYQEIVKRLRHD
jgi:hypothetical protein